MKGDSPPDPPADLPTLRIRSHSAESLKLRESVRSWFWAGTKVLTGQWRVSGSVTVVKEALTVADADARVLRILRKE